MLELLFTICTQALVVTRGSLHYDWEAELRRKQLETVRETAGSSFAPYLEPTIACEEIAVFVCHERFGVVSNKRLRYYLKPFSEVRSTGLRFHHRQPNLGMKVWYHIA